MKPTEHGGLRLESKKEFETTLGAVSHVLGHSGELPEELEGAVKTYERLEMDLAVQFERKKTDVETGTEGPSFVTELDETSGEFVLTALRLTANHHSDREVREHAGGMVMDFTMRAAELDVENQPPQPPTQSG